MSKPIQIVFASHSANGKSFLFEIPSDDPISSGEVLYVDTLRGETTAMACCDSFWVSREQLEQIVAGTGAYFPIKHVTGLQTQVTRMEKVPTCST